VELQFNKTVIAHLCPVVRQMQTQELTQEVRLTDGLPDIGRVLASWGQILIRGKQWHSGSAGVSGGVMVWVLYAPEGGSEPCSVETWLPFQMKWDFPNVERDGIINVLPYLSSVDARSVSARKLMVRASVGMMGEAVVPTETELYEPNALPDDVQILKNNYPLQIPRESGEKAFNLEEVINLPASAPGIDKLICYNLHPVVTDSRVMADKLIMRGTANLKILYRGNGGQLHSKNFEIPFSQYAELDKEYDSSAQARIDFAVTALELEQGEEENINLKAGLTGQYMIYDQPVIEIVEDAYSPKRNVTLQISELKLPAQLDNRTDTMNVELTMESTVERPVDVVFYQNQPRLFSEGDQLTAELSGYFQMLGYDADGQLQGATSRWEGDWSAAASENTRMDMTTMVVGTPDAMPGTGNAQLRADMMLNSVTTSQQGIPMVTGVELGELREPNPERPSLILRRTGTESLWELAKSTGSTVDAIKKANGLQQEPESDRMLLIPVSE